MDKKILKIICLACSNGKKHDFRLFKESKTQIDPQINVITDTGYQGLHAKTQMPKKKSHKDPLTKEDKLGNQNISRARMANENVIGIIKRFKIIAGHYRNRRKRFTRRSNLIAGIYNLELPQLRFESCLL